MPLSFIHARLATSAVIFTLICAVWGFVSYVRRRPVTGNYWGTLIIAELLFLAQAAVGVILLVEGAVPARGVAIHLLYGVTAVISLPAVYLYTGGTEPWRERLLYA